MRRIRYGLKMLFTLSTQLPDSILNIGYSFFFNIHSIQVSFIDLTPETPICHATEKGPKAR